MGITEKVRKSPIRFLSYVVLLCTISVIFIGLSACAQPTPAPTPTPVVPAPAPTPVPVIPAPTIPAPGVINTADDACEAVDFYLINLASKPEAIRFLKSYRDVRWGPHSFLLVEDFNQHTLVVNSEEDYKGWNVKRYIIQHVFDDAIFDRRTYPDAGELAQVLEVSGCWGFDNPRNETLYTVRWFVYKQTGEVVPENGNALLIKAKLME